MLDRDRNARESDQRQRNRPEREKDRLTLHEVDGLSANSDAAATRVTQAGAQTLVPPRDSNRRPADQDSDARGVVRLTLATRPNPDTGDYATVKSGPRRT